MNLLDILALIVLAAALAGLVGYARHDAFAGPRLRSAGRTPTSLGDHLP